MSESEYTEEMVKNMNLTITLLREKMRVIQSTIQELNNMHGTDNEVTRREVPKLRSIIDKFLGEDYG